MASNDKYWVGFDLGGTKMFACVLDSNFEVIGSDKRPTGGHEGVDAGLERIFETIDAALDEADVQKSDLAGIGIGCPGVVDLHKGILRNAPNLGWEDVPLGKLLEGRYGCATAVLNDVDAAAYGEYSHGAAQGAYCALAVFPGTGIGAGCVWNEQLFVGKATSCMEIGNMHFPKWGTEEGGDHTMLESVCGRLGIAATAAKLAYRGLAPYILNKSGTDISKIKSKTIGKAVEEDPEVKKMVKNAIRYLGIGIANAIDLLGPDKIVLGGGLVEAMPKLYLKGVESAVKEFANPPLLEDLEFSVAKLGDYAGVVGAASYVASQVE